MNKWALLLAEIESTCLEVILVPLSRPANSGGMKRVAISKNAKVYRDFCARHESSRGRRRRKPDTKIKRRNVIRLLMRLAAGFPVRSQYLPELQEMAKIALQRANRSSLSVSVTRFHDF